MQLNRTLLSFLSVFLFVNIAAAQQKYPATLLWRISGKNLTQPSYLYGTMHVQDRRLFYFGDSLYHALEKAESFAIEVNPDEMMDSLFKSLREKDTSALLKKVLSEQEYKRVAKQLEKKLKIPADKITLKKLAEERRNFAYNFKRKDDMPTMMDMYLFTIAKKQGKSTGGIEDVTDQVDAMNELGALDIDAFIRNDSVLQMNYLERMKKIYIERDLTALNEMVNGKLGNEFKNILLIKRNAKMAIRIDSLSHLKSGFFAIGAAHLPGDSGVIHLLQQRGFTVEPVMSSAYIAPEEYKYTAKELQWQKIEDDEKFYTVYMPGTPTEMLLSSSMPMKMYLDLADISYYGISVVPVTETDEKKDSLFARIINNYKKTGFEIKSTKHIMYKDATGVETYAIQNEQNYFRFRLLLKGNKLFIVIFGSSHEGNIAGANAEKFFNSLEISNEFTGGKKNWKSLSSEKNGFTMMAPARIEASEENQGDGTMADKFSAVDYTDGNYYSVIVTDTKAGFYIQNDSTNFEEYKSNLNTATKGGVKEFTHLKYKGYPACHFVALQKEDGMEFILEGYLVHRGNRSYVPLVVCKKENADFPEVTNFFRGFNFLPLKESGWKAQSLNNGAFTTFAPGAFTEVKTDTAGDTTTDPGFKKYITTDKNSGVSYSLDVETIDKYYWYKDDSSFFKATAEGYQAAGDSLISYIYHNDSIRNAEVIIKLHDVELYKKLKMFLNGDTTYTLYSFQPGELLHNEYFNKFFNEARFAHSLPVSIFNDKAAELLQALQSKDSIIFAAAKTALGKAEFSKQNLPLLYTALLKKYRQGPDDYSTVNDDIANKIMDLNDSTVVDFVSRAYSIKNDSTADVQMKMLGLLGRQKTTASYQLLLELLINKTPATGYVYDMMAHLADSLDLVKDFFPQAVKLYSDTVVGAAMIRLANALLDSNKVTAATALQNEKGVCALAGKQLQQMKNDADNYQAYNEDVITMLGRFNTKECNALLSRFAKLPDMWVKNNAILALLKNNQPVAQPDILKFANDREWRTAFYSSLKKIHKTSLFPKELYTQQKFAEGYLYTNLPEYYDTDISSAQFIKTKTAMVAGKLQRFFIYKVIVVEDDDKTPHLAICGAFNSNVAIAEVADEDVDVYLDYDGRFSLSTIDAKFKTYIEEKEKGRKTEE